MSIKLDFPILDAAGKNYLNWSQDIHNHLDTQVLLDVIYDESDRKLEVTREMNAKTMILFRRHLSNGVKSEFVAITLSKVLWDSLRERLDHKKTIWIPKDHHIWLNMGFQDFKSVTEYKAEVCRIHALLQYCGEQLTENDLLEKNYITFPNSEILLQKQYRQLKFTKFSELITQLLLDEKNSLILLRNNNSRLTGSKAFPMPDGNAIEYKAEVCRIRALLQYCGEQLTENDLLEKNYITFPNSEILLQKQYRQSKFTKFSELITQLLLDEKNSLILLRNNNSRLTGSKAFPMPDGNAIHGPCPRNMNRDNGQNSHQPRNQHEFNTRSTKRGLDHHP